jgi:hypothetical protein
MFKYIQSSALVAGLFLLSGCGSGACCTTDVAVAKGLTPDGGVSTIPLPLGESSTGTNNLVPKNVPSQPSKPDAVANNHDYLIGAKPCEVVKFKDIGQYADDANLTYKWLNRCGKVLSTEDKFEHKYNKKGAYETTLVVTDDKNKTQIDHICVLVGIDKSEVPLMADAGIDRTVDVNESVVLVGRLVCQSKENVTYTWSEDGSKLSFPLTLPVGEHTLVLTADDGQTQAKDSVVITVK